MDKPYSARTESLFQGLRSERTSTELLAPLMMDIAYDLRLKLMQLGIGDETSIRLLLRTMATQLIRTTQNEGVRRVSICGDQLVFMVPVRVGVAGDSAEAGHDTIFPPGAACGLWKRSNSAKKEVCFWEVLPVSYWHILVTEWLTRLCMEWLLQPHIKYAVADVGVTAFAQEIARVAGRHVLQHELSLQIVLLDAMCYPRELTRICLRNLQRHPAPPSEKWQSALLAHWHEAPHWSGSSHKLFVLALTVSFFAPDMVLTPNAVRDYLMRLGLSRNAWAHFYRLPSSVLVAIAHDLALFNDKDDQIRYLQTLSFWLSRMGKRYRYYRVECHRLQCAIVWPVRELTFMRSPTPDRSSLQHDACASIRLFKSGCDGFEFLLRRQATEIKDQEKLEALLLGFVSHVLADNRATPLLLSELVDVIDWFRAEGRLLPHTAFKQPYTALQSQTRHWHEALLRRRTEEAEQAAAQRRVTGESRQTALREARWEKRQLHWNVPLAEFEQQGFRLRALLNEQDLIDEGRLMQHCVGSYSRQCAQHESLIYAVSIDGVRLGTLEMGTYRQGKWFARQFKGKRNKNLMPLLEDPGYVVHKPFKEFLKALHHAESFHLSTSFP